MTDTSTQTQKAWEYNVYEFWVQHAGTPAERAKKDLENPLKMLKQYSAYFDIYQGIKVANICGSCGKKAIPLAILGADVTLFDISRDNEKYALEVAEAANVHIRFEVCDILEIDMERYKNYFDVVFMEGGILHYFHELDRFMDIMHSLLKGGGKMICSDFHPYTKINDVLQFGWCVGDYFSTDIVEEEMAQARFYEEEIRRQIPRCRYRKYTVSEIINSVTGRGFILKRFDEHPAWTDPKMPGEFTLIAEKKVS